MKYRALSVALLLLGISLPFAAVRADTRASASASPNIDRVELPDDDAVQLYAEVFAATLGRLSRGMMSWIEHATDYDTSSVLDAPPGFFFTAPGELLSIADHLIHVSRDERAFYDYEANVIVIVLPFSIDSILDQSIVLHELAHAVQFASERHWHCPDATEWEAYRLQELWLEDQGIDVDMNWQLIGMLSHCPPARPFDNVLWLNSLPPVTPP